MCSADNTWKYIHVFQLTFEHIQLKVICDGISIDNSNLSFCLLVTSHSSGKIPGFHHLSCIEFSACPMWLLKKLSECLPKGAVHAFHQYLEYVFV